ncbi:MAG TPA: hypothetical protein VKF40_09855 [Burkholderiales bacterium]|nr:hypothetical protein [Burkholderiales bacterium]
MSYDFAILTPEFAGASDEAALAAAVAVFEQEGRAPDPYRRLRDFVADLEAAGAADEDDGWLSVWPLSLGNGGVAVPTTYSDVDSNLVTLLRLAAGQGLVLVDLSAERVYPPAPGQPIGVIAGDGTRLGALTREHLESLLAELSPTDPWLVLKRDSNLYIQTYQQNDGTFLFERRDGNRDRHFKTVLVDENAVASRMWAWVANDPDWSANLDWERVPIFPAASSQP